MSRGRFDSADAFEIRMPHPDLERSNARAIACAVPQTASDLVLLDRFDYADAFQIALPRGTGIAADDWARQMFTPRGRVQRALAGAWNAVMGLEPPPGGSATGPFRLVSATFESAILIGDGERYRVRLAAPGGRDRLTLATFVQRRARVWHHLPRGVLVGHRRVAPILLERAVGAKTRGSQVVHG